ncbi:MAG TPA: hypothetical protein DCG63_01655, partial [Methylophilaceae bacterium]|nr:hypothetical protein [Methylophilaceae bacterium]
SPVHSAIKFKFLIKNNLLNKALPVAGLLLLQILCSQKWLINRSIVINTAQPIIQYRPIDMAGWDLIECLD